MFPKKLKKVGALLLAACLTIGSVQLPPLETKAASVNLALSATATACGVEAQTSHTANLANDGDASTRWASPVGNDAKWLQLAWNETQTMRAFVIKWERKNATTYAIETSDNGTNWTAVKNFTSAPDSNEQSITLDAPVQAKYVRLNVTANALAEAGSSVNWNNVSVYEFEVYADALPDPSEGAPKITEDGKRITMPEVPAGSTVRFCADYEQVIGEDGTIYAPYEDKVVKGFYETTTGTTKTKSEEYTITVPRKFDVTEEAGANEKPAVIPELQEWCGGHGQFAPGAGSRIVADAALADTAARFAADYEDVTGSKIEVVTGKLSDAVAGDFYLALDTDDAGLGKEGYILKIDNVAVVKAADATGAYWGVVSLLQILKQTMGTIPKGIARDYPKYEVRGFSFDIGRKPFSMDDVKQFAKNMSWYKMNNLQLHLSDNLIFHEDYPTLDQAAAESYAGFRLQSDVYNSEGKSATSEDMYYTKDEFRTFIKESRAMGLNIVPEFDMPAHALPFTRAFPEFMTKKAGGGHAYLIEELDIANPAATEKAKEIWADYFEGDDPVFDKDTIIHIGTDEYHGKAGQEGKELFRKFSDDMIKFVQGTGRTVRMWGSLSNKTGTTPVASEGVQLNIWNTGYANPQDMYNLGYDLINTLEGPNYIVPAAGYYNDYINARNIYNNWKPNVIGNLTAKAGDEQVLGACYAIWHDSIDTRANGISVYDSFDRFFKPLPAYSAKLWGEAEDRNYDEMMAVAAKTGQAPNTNVYCEIDTKTESIANYTFDETLTKDLSANGYDAVESKNVSQAADQSGTDGKALKLNGGESYVETPLDKIGMSASVSMKVRMDEDADGEQILCESKDEFGAYGTYAFKAVQKHTGKVGYSREGYDFSFDYTLPKGEWVELTFQGGQNNVALYVNGTLVDSNPDIYFANHETTELSAKLRQHNITKVCTMMVPFGRIGSKTKSFKGQIDAVAVRFEKEIEGEYGAIPQNELIATACSEASSEGPIGNVLDGDPSTYWHQNWSSDVTVSEENPHWVKLAFKDGNARSVSKLTYLPRQDSQNGRIFQYGIDAELADGTVVKNIASGTWANSTDRKSAEFDAVIAKSLTLNIYDAGRNDVGVHATAAELNLYEAFVVDNAMLQAEIDKYAGLKETDYTAQSWQVVAKAVEDAKAIIANTGSTDKDRLLAYDALLKVAGSLREKPELGEPEIGRLLDEIDAAKEVLETTGEYTAESLKVYQDALNAAMEIAKDSVATDAQYAAAAKALAEAKEGLVHIDGVGAAIADAEKLLANTEGYTPESVAALKKALADVKALMNDPKATRAEIEEALKKLMETKLVKVSPEPDKPVKTVPAVGKTASDGVLEYKVTKSDAKAGTAAVVKQINKNKKKVVIPATIQIDGYTFKVTSVSAKVFQKNKKLKTVVIGSNVTNIGKNSFFQCKKLKNITFKGVKVPKIGGKAFKGTHAKAKVIAPKKMAKKAFKNLQKQMKRRGLSKKASFKKK